MNFKLILYHFQHFIFPYGFLKIHLFTILEGYKV